jgi:hypothetical protein
MLAIAHSDTDGEKQTKVVEKDKVIISLVN